VAVMASYPRPRIFRDPVENFTVEFFSQAGSDRGGDGHPRQWAFAAMMCSSSPSCSRQGGKPASFNPQARWSIPWARGAELSRRRFFVACRAFSWSLGRGPWHAEIPFLLVFAMGAVGFLASLRIDRFERVRAAFVLCPKELW